MEKYSEYKDSGVYFLPIIPNGWQVIKAKYLFKEEKRLVRSNDEIVTCFRDGQVTLRKNRRLDGFTNSMKEIGYQGVRKGDLVIHNMDAFAGAIGVSDSDGKATPVYSCCTPLNDNINQYYYCYLLRFLAKNGFIMSLAKGIRERSTDFRFNDFKELYLPVPHIEEQKIIVRYIDKYTSQIDEAIAQQQKMIDLLNERKQIIINNAVTKGLDPNVPMKDSGVDWIGCIPEHWEILKFKHILKIFGRIGFRGYNTSDLVDEGEGAISISPSNMKDGAMDYKKCTYLSWKKYFESPEIMVNDGDILFVKTGSTYGKSSLVSNLPLEATINPQLVVFKDLKCYNKYLGYLLQSEILKKQVETTVIGGTIPTLSQEKILNFTIPLPCHKEQEDIVSLLDQQLCPLNEEIRRLNTTIDLFQERKQIIINEVVTGKVKVS